jgi:hypothetical protein
MRPEGYEQLWAELPTLLFIPLTQGKFTVIDSADWQIISHVRLYAMHQHNDWYASTKLRGKNVGLARLIIESGLRIDHKNRITLDNRRSNLRPATAAQNSANRACYSASGFKGVQRRRRQFRAFIQGPEKTRYLGSFKTAEQAAEAFDLAAIQRWGEFAGINFEHRRTEYLKQIESERISA